MKTDFLANASALSDQDLLVQLGLLAGREREATALLVAHLAALDTRPALYAARGHGSLFAYCRDALRLSEDAARRLQELLRREIPDGDPAVIVDRALTLLLDSVERTKLGAAAGPRPRAAIRPAADQSVGKTPHGTFLGRCNA